MAKKLPVTEMNYKLSEAVPYASKGEQVFSFNIKLKAPSGKHRAHLIRLKQGFFRAVLFAQKSNTNRQAAEPMDDAAVEAIDGKMLMQMFYMSDIDLVALQDEFRGLLAANIGEIADGVPLTQFMIEQINQDDFEGLMGEYMAVFIVSSLI
jgi:hypothetical protein